MIQAAPDMRVDVDVKLMEGVAIHVDTSNQTAAARSKRPRDRR